MNPELFAGNELWKDCLEPKNNPNVFTKQTTLQISYQNGEWNNIENLLCSLKQIYKELNNATDEQERKSDYLKGNYKVKFYVFF